MPWGQAVCLTKGPDWNWSALSLGLIVSAFDENLVFFFSPTGLQAKELRPDQRVAAECAGLVVGEVAGMTAT